MMIVWRGFVISMLPRMRIVTVLTNLFVHSHLVFVVYPTYICVFDELKNDLLMAVITLMCTSVPIPYTVLAFQGVGVSRPFPLRLL